MWRCLSLVCSSSSSQPLSAIGGLVCCICSFIFKYSYFLQMFTWQINTGVLLIGENVVVFFCVVGVEVLFRFKAIYFIICKLHYEIL